RISEAETDYLLAAVNRFLAKPVSARDVVSSYAGVRPLYDDGSDDPSQVTRDYVLKVDHAEGRAPLVAILGGKITTYRRLAEEAMEKLRPFFPGLAGPWTGGEPLPGGGLPRFNAFRDGMHAKHSRLGRDLVEGIVRRHGDRAGAILGEARSIDDLGRHFGAGLTEREVEYLRREEW